MRVHPIPFYIQSILLILQSNNIFYLYLCLQNKPPVFLLTKKKNYENSKPLIDFLFSKQVAEVLGADGKFPQTNPEYDNKLEETQNFLWAGWDFIRSNDIGEILSNTEKWFYGEE